MHRSMSAVASAWSEEPSLTHAWKSASYWVLAASSGARAAASSRACQNTDPSQAASQVATPAVSAPTPAAP